MDGNLSPVPPVIDTRWELVQRTVSSPSFQRTPRLRELLLYLCDMALQNRLDDLREHAIGCAVFGRQPNYNSGDDNIVRVEVRHLRKRLADHFATDGKDEPSEIVIPKGSYMPTFLDRVAPEIPELVPVLPLPAAPPPAPGRLRRWFRWQSVVILLLAGVCVWQWKLNRDIGAQLAAVQPRHVDRGPLWSLLFRNDQRTLVICADSSLVMIQALIRRPLTLEQYVKKDYGTESSDFDPNIRNLLRRMAAARYTDLADLRLVQWFHDLNASHWGNVEIRSARTAQTLDFKDGNSLLLGSNLSNPWTRLFEPNLNFEFDFDYKTSVPLLRNKNPQPGEQKEYRAAWVGDSGEAYSRIALVPNMRNSGAVLLLGGTTAEGTEAAGQFITNPETYAHLIHTLKERNHGRMPYFEVLLRSRTMVGIAKNAEIVALRIVGDAEPLLIPGNSPGIRLD